VSAVSFDWQYAKSRLADASALDLTSADLERIFAERARELAIVKQGVDVAAGAEHFCFAVGRTRFAVELGYVRSLIVPRFITRLPFAPPHMDQVTYFGGRVVSLLQLDRLLGVASAAKLENPKFLLLESENCWLGVATTRLVGIERINIENLTAANQSSKGGEVLLGITSDMQLVLDARRIVGDLKIESGRGDHVHEGYEL
jgi:chemotaxis signal transduction protein